jgi:hypothetical protein
MKQQQYKSRKAQAMADVRQVQRGKMSIRTAIRNAAMCGAFEARSQALDAIQKDAISFQDKKRLTNVICNIPILELLGWK